MSDVNVQMSLVEMTACVELLIVNGNDLDNAAGSACYIADIGGKHQSLNEYREDITELLKQVQPIVRQVIETLANVATP